MAALSDDELARRAALARAFSRHVPHNEALGMRLVELTATDVTFELPYDARLAGNPDTGVLHGGVITALLDATSGIAVFGALANVVAASGLAILGTYLTLLVEFYFSLVLLWVILLGAGAVFLGRRIWALIRYIRQPLLIAFSTAVPFTSAHVAGHGLPAGGGVTIWQFPAIWKLLTATCIGTYSLPVSGFLRLRDAGTTWLSAVAGV